MENFIVSARKYRPQAFDEVVGQQHVTNTLLNAINQNHLAQALLFTGPRGVGKTTCARILAKMINSEEATGDDQDFSFNIFELDAASNNSVDDIRNLIDQVRFAPQVGNYKVYIIDEVHMLSQAAFNAFLKTLEEPPAHAIFILATTEKHKIIPTILSRCQIFDFKRITVEDTAKHLKGVAEKEGITADSEALHIIAQKADGALRDALSIFDRIVSFSGKNITYNDVITNLRILDYDYYFRTTDLILAGDRSGLLLIFNEILDNGFDGHLFANGLAAHFRDLLVCQDPKTLQLLEVGESTKARYGQQSKQVDPMFLLRGLKLLGDVDVKYKGSNNARLLVELSLLQLSQLVHGEPEKKKPSPEVNRKSEVGGHKRGVDTPKAEERQPQATSHIPQTANSTPPAPQPVQEKSASYKPEPSVTPATPAKKTATTPGKLKKRRSSFSISGSLEGKASAEGEEESDVDETAINPALPKDAFDEAQFTNIWNEYIEHVKGQGHQRIYSTLANKTIKLKENFTIELHLENEIQDSYFTEGKADILKYVRQKLNNFSVQFEISIIKSAKKLEPYSPQEKFQYLAEKNPNLLILKQKLDLDIE
ncbi:DNA polymerase III subunit gamma/tau [Owenweeksia hongkongensis]|uniref:DNA polymerase III subunit gamma/tau n=1 Tax=Owenweeksia hongkongensis TaxID=253245 RepID=UPI003A948BE3